MSRVIPASRRFLANALCIGALIATTALVSSAETIVQCGSDGAKETKGGEIQRYRIDSPYQEHPTTLRVLLPDDFTETTSYKTLYVLPVVVEAERKHGDGLLEIQKHHYQNLHQLICVAPEFTSKPWYADHDEQESRKDESHLLKTIISFVDQNFPTINTKL